MSNKEEYIRKMQTKLEEWNTEIDTLTARAVEVAAEVKNEYSGQIESLKEKQATARQKIEEIQKAGGTAWVDVKSGIDVAWSAVEGAINSAKSRFK